MEAWRLKIWVVSMLNVVIAMPRLRNIEVAVMVGSVVAVALLLVVASTVLKV